MFREVEGIFNAPRACGKLVCAASAIVCIAMNTLGCEGPASCTDTATCWDPDTGTGSASEGRDVQLEGLGDIAVRNDGPNESDARAGQDSSRQSDVPSTSDHGNASDDASRADVNTSTLDVSDVSSVDASASDAPIVDVVDAADANTCTIATRPSQDRCIIDEKYGVFVSPLGNDTTGTGTRKFPYKTITKALTVATNIKSVYACDNGTPYTEQVSMTSGAKLFGGFACNDWVYATSRRAIVKAPASPALSIQSALGGALVEDMQIEAPDATTPGSSSFAAMIVSTKNVWLRRVSLIAGQGGEGLAGVDGMNGEGGALITLDQGGKDASCKNPVASQTGGAWPNLSVCGSRGGAGGTAIQGVAGTGGFAGIPGPDNGGPMDMDGLDGANGANGMLGIPAPAGGTFDVGGYTPGAPGGMGEQGAVGQGGGGGSASSATNTMCIGASGGAGGMGGCGGKPGTGGNAGGASVALLSWLSNATLEGCTLQSSRGGAGGKGGNGGNLGQGQGSATGGSGDGAVDNGHMGGWGGDGGLGGSGAGGTGGPSYALATKGASPQVVDGTTLFNGTGGTPGVGGMRGPKAPDGFPGDSAQEFIVP